MRHVPLNSSEENRKGTPRGNAVFLPFRSAPLIAAMATKDLKEGAEVFTCHGPGYYWLGVVEAMVSSLVLISDGW